MRLKLTIHHSEILGACLSYGVDVELISGFGLTSHNLFFVYIKIRSNRVGAVGLASVDNGGAQSKATLA